MVGEQSQYTSNSNTPVETFVYATSVNNSHSVWAKMGDLN